MKRFLLIGIILLAGCRTSAATPDSPPAAVQVDPFAAAEQWIAKGDRGGELEATLRGWSTPRVERIHRAEDGYVALVTGEQGTAAVLLTIEQRDGAWVVVDAKLDRSDYLWPAQ